MTTQTEANARTIHAQIKAAILARAQEEANEIQARAEADLAWEMGATAAALGWEADEKEAAACARLWGRVLARLEADLPAVRKGGSLLAPMAVAR